MPIFEFACRSPENLDTLYLNVVGIPPFPKRTITKKIDLCKHYDNYEEDKDKWVVDYDGYIGTFIDDIADEK